MSWIEQAAAAGIALGPGERASFARLEALLLEWNARTNLSGVREPEAIGVRHFLDSLAPLAAAPELFAAPRRALDLGSGAGFPGLPLAIARPDSTFVLLEATAKKARFLRAAAAELELGNVRVLEGRAEELGHAPDERAAYDLVLARAVAPLAVLAELGLPFLATGGRLAAWKGPEAGREVAEAAGAIALLGGRRLATLPAPLAEPLSGHVLVLVEKVAETPPAYPRRPGLPAKRPLKGAAGGA